MRIINVIVSNEEEGIVSIDSFGVFEEQLVDDVVESAEHCYLDKCVSLKFEGRLNSQECRDNCREEFSEKIDDGYCTINNTTITIVWSEI